MTTEQKGMIVVLQQRGFGYRKIAEETGLPMEAVKTYCRRHPITEADGEKGLCEQCHALFAIEPHRKKKRFCSDACRMAWWKAHPELIKRNKVYPTVCECCGATFDSIRQGSRFCSRKCYADFRRKEKHNG